MVVRRDSRFLELARFGVVQLPERYANFHAESADVADDLQHLLEFLVAVAHAAPRRAHAKAGGAVLMGGARHLKDGVPAQERLSLHAGVVPGALGTVGAILRTPASLDRKEGAKLHLIRFPVFQKDVARLLDEFEKWLVVNSF